MAGGAKQQEEEVGERGAGHRAAAARPRTSPRRRCPRPPSRRRARTAARRAGSGCGARGRRGSRRRRRAAAAALSPKSPMIRASSRRAPAEGGTDRVAAAEHGEEHLGQQGSHRAPVRRAAPRALPRRGRQLPPHRLPVRHRPGRSAAERTRHGQGGRRGGLRRGRDRAAEHAGAAVRSGSAGAPCRGRSSCPPGGGRLLEPPVPACAVLACRKAYSPAPQGDRPPATRLRCPVIDPPAVRRPSAAHTPVAPLVSRVTPLLDDTPEQSQRDIVSIQNVTTCEVVGTASIRTHP